MNLEPRFSETTFDPEQKDKLKGWLQEAGHRSKTERLVAVFDWDNTMIKNDIGDSLCGWMLTERKLNPIPWHELFYLNDHARTLLHEKSHHDEHLLAHMIWKDQTPTGERVYNPVPHTFKAAYGFFSHFLYGHTEEDVRAFSKAAIRHALESDHHSELSKGSRWAFGGVEVPGSIRYYREMVNLVQGLAEAGVEVWMVSASPKILIEEAAALVGIRPDRVIGAQLEQKDGRFTTRFLPCGGHENIFPYREGKRAWINHTIFGTHEVLETHSPTFLAAGDALTDLSMFEDAQYRVIVDRNVSELKEMAQERHDTTVMHPLDNPT